MTQLTYAREHAIGYEGDPARSDPLRVRPMRNNSGADLPFGRALAVGFAEGASDQAVKLPNASTDKILGVNLADRARAPQLDGTEVNGVRDDGMVNMLVGGSVYVSPETAVTVYDSVFARFGAGATTDGEDLAGRFRKDADVVTAWTKNTAVALGVRRALAGKVYQCITAGTTEDSDTPALESETGADITDGTAHWRYVGICDATTRASALEIAGARWLSSSAANGIAALSINLP